MSDKKRTQGFHIFVRVLLVLFTFTLSSLPISAQDFFDLTAQQVKIDTLLPVFTWQKQLKASFADSIYTVQIDYPEFIDMQEDDIRRYHQICSDPLPEMPIIHQSIGVVRKQGILEVSFVPLVFRNGKYQKLVSFGLNVKRRAITRSFSRASEEKRYTDHSVLSEGNWAKIRIPQSGFYQLTDAFIRKAGFSDLNKVKVYGYGGALQPESLSGDYLTATDDLKEVPTCTIGGKRIFYGVGPVTWEKKDTLQRTRNPYSDYGYYFLTESDGEPMLLSEDVFKNTYYPGNETYHSLYENDDYAWFQGGSQLFDKTSFSIGSPQTYTLAATGSTGILAIAMTYDGLIEATIEVNGINVGTMSRQASLDSYSKAEAYVWTYQLDQLQAENTIRITQTAGDMVHLDYIDLYHDTPQELPDFQTSTLQEPTFVSAVANQDHHADEATDMVIIIPTTQQLLSQAERIKRHHEEKDGLRINIIPADELYNEFSSGTPDATAYRRYLKMLYDRATTDGDMPKYLLLFGDGAWDNRMHCDVWNGYQPDDFLLCYESENSFSSVNCYVSDDFFCLLDDNEQIRQKVGGSYTYQGKPDVAVGRFPVRTIDEATTLVDKTIDYAQNANAGAWQNTICIMGDDGNNNTHMQTADKVATRIQDTYPSYTIKKIYWDAYTRVSSATGYCYPDVTRLIKQQMANGALMMNYSGHGAPYAFSHELVMKLADFEESTSKHLPLWVTASCDIMPFDGQEDNIGETVMLNKRGGGVAFFGTTRTVYASYNESMNLAFTQYVLSPNYTIGEAVRQAKCDLVSQGSDTSPNKLQYTLLGDPALRLACPVNTIVVDSINGQATTTDIQLAAGTVASIKGRVLQDQSTANSFNGLVTAEVYDAIETIVCKLNDSGPDGAEEPFVYQDRTQAIYNGSDSIHNGQFQITFAVPRDISYTDGNGLITLYAINDDKSLTAHGEDSHFVLNGHSTEQTDSIGPNIYCYLNSKTFTDGDKVNPTPYFMAELYDESGINALGSGIGHDLELIIDNDPSRTYILNNYFTYDFGDYRSGKVGYSIPELSEGKHQLLFRAWDVNNNSSTAKLVFEVERDAASGSFSVVCTKNPATESTSFVVTHDRVGSPITIDFDVFDLSGRQMWHQQENGIPQDGTYTIYWDLHLNGGSRMQTGVYLCRFQLDDGPTKTVKLIVLSNN